MNDNMRRGLFQFLITLFTGYFGIHKFLNGQIGLGIAYFFTGGFFGIGWIYDIIVSGLDLYHIYCENRSQQLEHTPFPYLSRHPQSTFSSYKEKASHSGAYRDTVWNIADTLVQFLNENRGCRVTLIDAQTTENGFDFIMEASSPDEAHHILSFEEEFNEILKDEFHFSYLYRSQFLIQLIPHSNPGK